MKKTLIALAVAGLVAAPAAMAEVTVYGQGHVSLDNLSGDAGLITYLGVGAGEQTLAVTNRASRVGVKAAEDLGNGLTAVVQMEWGVDMTGDRDMLDGRQSDVDGDGTNGKQGVSTNITARNQIVGLAGSFGTVAVGRHDTPYKMSTGSLDVFSDTAADYNAVIGTNGFDARPTDVLAYLSPDFNGFSVQAAIVAVDLDGTADTDGDDDDMADATSVAVQYKNGPLFVSAAMESYADTAGAAVDGNDAPSATKLGVGYDFGVAKVGFVYEAQSKVDDILADDDVTAMLVNVAMPLAGNTLIAEYGQKTQDDADVDTTLMAIGLAHGFSKSTSGYVAYGNVGVEGATIGGDKDPNASILTAGMVVKF